VNPIVFALRHPITMIMLVVALVALAQPPMSFERMPFSLRLLSKCHHRAVLFNTEERYAGTHAQNGEEIVIDQNIHGGRNNGRASASGNYRS
jgi:hypothetical protein